MAGKRDGIMVALVERLKSIRIVNGYHSDLGLNVFEWRPKVGDPSGGYVPTEPGELPALHVSDPALQTAQDDLRGNESNRLSIEVEIAHEAGATGQEMRDHIADVRKAVGVDPKWSGLARRTFQEMTTDSIRMQADRSFYRSQIRFTIEYTTSAFAEE